MRINTATTVAKLLIGLMTLFYVAYATAITIPSNRNPKYNSSINPKYNSSINPKYNSSINPKYNSSVNPKQASSADLLSKVRGSSRGRRDELRSALSCFRSPSVTCVPSFQSPGSERVRTRLYCS